MGHLFHSLFYVIISRLTIAGEAKEEQQDIVCLLRVCRAQRRFRESLHHWRDLVLQSIFSESPHRATGIITTWNQKKCLGCSWKLIYILRLFLFRLKLWWHSFLEFEVTDKHTDHRCSLPSWIRCWRWNNIYAASSLYLQSNLADKATVCYVEAGLLLH